MSASGTNIFANLSSPKFFDAHNLRIDSDGKLAIENKNDIFTWSRLDPLRSQSSIEESMVETTKGIAKLAAEKPELFREAGVDIIYFSNNLNALKRQIDIKVRDPKRKKEIYEHLDRAIASAAAQLKFNRYVLPVASFAWNWVIKPVFTLGWNVTVKPLFRKPVAPVAPVASAAPKPASPLSLPSSSHRPPMGPIIGPKPLPPSAQRIKSHPPEKPEQSAKAFNEFAKTKITEDYVNTKGPANPPVGSLAVPQPLPPPVPRHMPPKNQPPLPVGPPPPLPSSPPPTFSFASPPRQELSKGTEKYLKEQSGTVSSTSKFAHPPRPSTLVAEHIDGLTDSDDDHLLKDSDDEEGFSSIPMDPVTGHREVDFTRPSSSSKTPSGVRERKDPATGYTEVDFLNSEDEVEKLLSDRGDFDSIFNAEAPSSREAKK